MQSHGHHRTCFQIHRMFGDVGALHASALHFQDP
jgi:hypothetical protein